MKNTFFEVLDAAFKDLSEHGFDSMKRLEGWLQKIDLAIKRTMVPEETVVRALKSSLGRVYFRALERGLARRHPKLSAYTLASIKPKLRAELDRRILASTDLIRLNRRTSRIRALQRFAGWATSIPAGGNDTPSKDAEKAVRKSISGLPFEERRVVIDQGHKLAATLDNIVAKDGGAIAMIWRHVKERPPEYDARPEHLARNGKIFVIRNNWAIKKGYMKLGGSLYTDQITAPGEEVFCRCSGTYIYNLRDLPEQFLTASGRKALADARVQVRNYATH